MPMTSRERILATMRHQEPDRVPFWDGPWGVTVERWHREGLPADTNWVDYFGLDHISQVGGNNGPRFPTRIIEETDEYQVFTTDWGATWKDFKHSATVPETIDFLIKTPDDWYQKVKPRITYSEDRVNWDHLAQYYPTWRERGDLICGGLWFGFDVTHSRMVGTERTLEAMIDDPDWIVDLWTTQLDLSIRLLDEIWDRGYTFDVVRWPDDMGYKHSQFFSPKMYRELLKPLHARAVEWAHGKGCLAHLHSCGDIRPFIPDLIEIGFDALNPLEVKAGCDPVTIKQEYGDQLCLHGGINAVLWDQPEAIKAEIAEVVPKLMAGGGYIFASDHSIPSAVSLDDMRSIVDLIKDLGTY